MEITHLITEDQRKVLSVARETYGDTAQILVANEELCELAAVCAKFPRYDSKDRAKEHLKVNAIDEVSDVLIILDHVVNIFDLTEEEIKNRIIGKIHRLERWLASSNSMEQTTVDRDVPEEGQLSLYDSEE